MSQFDSGSKNKSTLILSKLKTLMNVDLFLSSRKINFSFKTFPCSFCHVLTNAVRFQVVVVFQTCWKLSLILTVKPDLESRIIWNPMNQVSFVQVEVIKGWNRVHMTFISCEIGHPFKIIFKLIWLSLLESFINYTSQVSTVIYIWKYKRKSKSDDRSDGRLYHSNGSFGLGNLMGVIAVLEKIKICVNSKFRNSHFQNIEAWWLDLVRNQLKRWKIISLKIPMLPNRLIFKDLTSMDSVACVY